MQHKTHWNTYTKILTCCHLELQKHYVVFGGQIEALNFDICNINEVITLSQIYLFSPLVNKQAALRGEEEPRTVFGAGQVAGSATYKRTKEKISVYVVIFINWFMVPGVALCSDQQVSLRDWAAHTVTTHDTLCVCARVCMCVCACVCEIWSQTCWHSSLQAFFFFLGASLRAPAASLMSWVRAPAGDCCVEQLSVGSELRVHTHTHTHTHSDAEWLFLLLMSRTSVRSTLRLSAASVLPPPDFSSGRFCALMCGWEVFPRTSDVSVPVFCLMRVGIKRPSELPCFWSEVEGRLI